MNKNIQKNHKTTLSKKCKIAKKIVLIITSVAIMMTTGCVTAFAAVDTGAFISSAATVLKAVIILIGAGLGVWGVVNLIEGYGNDNPGAKSQGMKQLMSGIGLIALALILVPVLQNMMTGAMSS